MVVKKNTLVGMLFLLYYILPKFPLIFIPGIYTPIRCQDFIVLALILIQRKFERTLILILILLLMSFLLGGVFSGSQNIALVGSVRIFEYIIMGYVVAKKAGSNFVKYLFFLILCQFTIGLSQYFLIIPNYDTGRGIIYSKQFSGSYGTPAEFAYFMVTMVFIFLNVYRTNYIINYIVTFLTLANGVRAAVLGLTYNFYVRQKKIFKVFIIIISIPFALIFLKQSGLGSIIINIFDLSVDYITNFNASRNDIKMPSQGIAEDRSLSQRLGKWLNSLSYLYNNPEYIPFGLGLYTQLRATDGGIIRLIYEIGIFGTFGVLFILSRSSWALMFLFVLCNLFFDYYMSSVTLPLFVFAYFYTRDHNALGFPVKSRSA